MRGRETSVSQMGRVRAPAGEGLTPTPSPEPVGGAHEETPVCVVEAAGRNGRGQDKESSPPKTEVVDEKREAKERKARLKRTKKLNKVGDEEMTGVIVGVLQDMMRRNREDGESWRRREVDEKAKFFYKVRSEILCLEEFVRRAVKGVQCRIVLLTWLILIDRLHAAHEQLALNSQNMHYVLSSSLLLAFKYQEDITVSQEYFRELTGVVSLAELNRLEIEFMKLIGWSVFVPSKVYDAYSKYMLKEVGAAAKKAKLMAESLDGVDCKVCGQKSCNRCQSEDRVVGGGNR